MKDALHAAGFYADAELTSKKMEKKIRESQLAQYNYILVVGKVEAENRTVNIRTRENKVLGERKLDDFIEDLKKSVEKYE